MNKTKTTTVGMFGTCGGSKWREKFIQTCEEKGISYFNPQVDNWTPELADLEAEHLVEDGIILFPVTGETYGTGSLAETGFSIFQAIRSNSERYIVLFVADDLDPALKVNDEIAYKESIRARKLVKAHLRKNKAPGVFVVDSLEAMHEAMLSLHQSMQLIEKVRAISL